VRGRWRCRADPWRHRRRPTAVQSPSAALLTLAVVHGSVLQTRALWPFRLFEPSRPGACGARLQPYARRFGKHGGPT
jgi:hypothetical protein